MRMWPALEIQQADDDDLIQAFLIDFNLAAIDDSRYFFHRSDDRDRAAMALRDRFPKIDIHPVDVPDEDWAARSQSNLRSVRIGALVISPPWDREADSIVIEPSMGFGTGHHATTRLCLAALQRIDLRGRSVIDVGTGSGVLAIAARRLGASGVLAIDDDPDAIASAEANVRLNQESRIALEIADFRSAKMCQFDLVIAYLTGALLIASAGRLESLSILHGRLILSGFMEHEEQEVLRTFGGCALEWRAQEDEWGCVSLIAA